MRLGSLLNDNSSEGGFHLLFKGGALASKSFKILNVEKIGSTIKTKSIAQKNEAQRLQALNSPADLISVVDNFAKAGTIDLILEIKDASDLSFFEDWTSASIKSDNDRKASLSLKSKNNESNIIVKLIRSWPTNVELINAETHGHSTLRVTLYYDYLSLRVSSSNTSSVTDKIPLCSSSSINTTQVFKEGVMKANLQESIKNVLDKGSPFYRALSVLFDTIDVSNKKIIVLSPKYLIGKANFISRLSNVKLGSESSENQLASIRKISLARFSSKDNLYNKTKFKLSQLKGVKDSLVMNFLVFNSSKSMGSIFNVQNKSTDVSLNKLLFLSLAMSEEVSEDDKKKTEPENYVQLIPREVKTEDNRLFNFFDPGTETPINSKVFNTNLNWIKDTRSDKDGSLSPEIFAVPIDKNNHFYCKVRNYNIKAKGFSKDGVPSYFEVGLTLEGVNLFNRYLTLG